MLDELKLVSAAGSLSRKEKVNSEPDPKALDFKQFKDKVLKEIEESNKQIIEQKAKELSQKIINESKESIKQLEDKIQEEQQLNKRLEDKNMQISKEFKEQAEELEAHKQKIAKMIEEEEERKEREVEEQEDPLVKFKEIYEKNIGSKIPAISNFYLKINLNDTKHKSLMKDCVTSKLRLPDLKEIQINYISNSDSDLANFLNDCTPAHLRLLVINYSRVSTNTINSAFYVNSLMEAVANITKEIYLSYLNFNTENLRTVVMAAHKVERIVFNHCNIHCTYGLDFDYGLDYNTKYLSFQNCGNTNWKECTTSWKSNSFCFSHIVNAIRSSELRTSLQQLNIYNNQALTASKVEEELNAWGMPHISVVVESANPLSS